MTLTTRTLTIPRKRWRFQAFRAARRLITDQSLDAWSARSAAADPTRSAARSSGGAAPMPPRGGRPATPPRARRAPDAASSLVDLTVFGPLFARGPKADTNGGRG